MRSLLAGGGKMEIPYPTGGGKMEIPSPAGGGLGWGQMQNDLLHRACPHPNLPPEGEGVKKINHIDA
jgi:hypothetical protein